jgi:hypothetical protein
VVLDEENKHKLKETEEAKVEGEERGQKVDTDGWLDGCQKAKAQHNIQFITTSSHQY